MKKEIMDWLASRSTSPFFAPDRQLTLVSIPKNEKFSYLYCQRITPLSREALEFGGIYCARDRKIYCATVKLRYCIGDDADAEDLMLRTDAVLQAQLTQKVREKVEAVIGNDRSKLKVSEISDRGLLRDLESMKRYSAKNIARIYFLEGESLDFMDFSCDYEFRMWERDNILRYILDPDGFAEEEANVYMDTHQEQMLYKFLSCDLVREEYTALASDLSNPVHIIRKIMTAVKASNAKTVNITVLKDGRQLVFKADAGELSRDCPGHYSEWNIAAADRRLIKAEFGSNFSYTPQEILRITYGRKVLYEAESNQAEQAAI